MFLIPADIVYSNLIKPSREIIALKIINIRWKNALQKLGSRSFRPAGRSSANLSGFGSNAVKVSGSGWTG